MKSFIICLAFVSSMSAMAGNSVTTKQSMTNTLLSDNPLLKPWTGPFGGIPPFNNVNVSDFIPAMEEAMKQNLAEIEVIATNKAMPNFENTIVAMEQSGASLERVMVIYGIWGSNMSSKEFQEVELVMDPKLAGFFDQITQNTALFKRIEQVATSQEMKTLSAEQQRLTEKYYKDFVRSGARLEKDSKEKLAAINQQLAGLYTRFSQNLLADESELVVTMDSEAQLEGLPESLKESAASVAKERGEAGKWMITNTRSSVDPFLTYASNRKMRETVWRMFVDRGDNGGEHDNNAIITEILKLRKQRASLLGYESHAHWRLENTMAKTPEKALELMKKVWTPAIARVKEEVADMQALATSEGATFQIEPWDYRYYAEKVRKAKYDLDQNEVKQYLQLEKLREGMFWVAGELFGFNFSPVKDVPVYHPDVRVWEVTNKVSGKHIGLWYFDAYAREGKRSGAWMNNYRDQSRYHGEVTTIVSNNSNFVKGKAGEPVLISWDDASTLFHEFGHALHGLSSNVTYRTLSGTAVVRDYVEFPSQLLEHWLSTPEVLNRFALHYQTGAALPQALIARIEKAATFNEGFATTEYLSSALIDMQIHLSNELEIDPDKFEREHLANLNMPKELVMRHRTPQFAHIFSGDGYSAGYYSYLWSDVLTADAFEAFTEAGGAYDKAVAKRLIDHVFSVGNTIDPAQGYKAFRGHDADTKALMRKRGFPVN